MKFGRVWVISIAFAVIMSGLAFLTVSTDPDPITIEPLSEPGGEEPRGVVGVPRVVCVEDFGFWDCGPCAIYEPFLIQAIENYGYSQVAPLFYHKFPGHGDPIAAYSPLDNIFREMYYSSWAAPWTHLDGIFYPSTLDTSAIEGYFDDRLAIPANIALTTTGDINGLNATVSVNIEAVADIGTTDLIVQFALWEDHINVTERFGGPAPNGEEEFRWAMWTMEPDAFGVPIWPTGANPGDTVDIQQVFTLEPEWNTSELGVTVFVQGNSSRFIEQAAVEDFTDNVPFVDILTPDPYVADRVLSGVIPIEWNATDFEDDDSTLDVNIDYSPDGGTSWLNVMSGVDNNSPPYLWDTVAEGIPDGVNYILRLEATDSSPQTNVKIGTQPFSINNTIDDEWFFQVQVSGPNMDLDMKPVEMISNELHTSIPGVGDYLVGTWETTKTFSTASINGDWTFDIYGCMGNSEWSGNLYAKVFGSSDPVTPLAITGIDDENVGTFTSVHKFTWTESLIGDIPDGDSIIVEIWIQVTAGGPAIEQTSNPGFDTGSTGWTKSLWHAWNTGPYPHMGTWNSTDGNPNGWIEFELPFLHAVGSFLGGYWEQALTPSGAPTSASLSFDWICTDYKEYSPGSMNNVSFYVFIDSTPGEPTFGTEVWTQNVTNTTSWASVGPIDVLGIVNSASTYYLKVGVWADGLSKDSWGIGGYDNVQLIWQTPTNTFTTVFDYDDTQSSVRPSIGPTIPIYDIEIPDPSGPWPAWRFVSFPIDVSGNAETVLNDSSWGDGGTSWDHVQWFDADDPVDSWKSYAPFKPASLSDLLSVNNTMGLWIHITANGGDGNLTVGSGVCPSSTSITLYAGWNMVGYPTLTEKSITDALVGTGYDRPVEGFNATAPYHISPLADTYMMKPGEGYWVHVPADTNWIVDW